MTTETATPTAAQAIAAIHDGDVEIEFVDLDGPSNRYGVRVHLDGVFVGGAFPAFGTETWIGFPSDEVIGHPTGLFAEEWNRSASTSKGAVIAALEALTV